MYTDNDNPMVFSDMVLKSLCNQYNLEIGAGTDCGLPNIKVRYVIDTNKFGYTYFGDFFFFSDGVLPVESQRL